MLGMGLNAQAQEESRLFFFGFEDGMASFTDSTHPLDSITKVRYYAGSPTSAGWDIVYEKDSLMYMLNGIQPLTSRGDVYDIITDEEGEHANEFKKMGAEGGNKYFKYVAGDASSEANDYNADLFIRGVKVEDNTSYRLVYYVKATPTGKMYTDLMRGFYNSEKPISLSGASGNEFRLHKEEFMDTQWERVTMMSYYQNDSVAERHMYNAGYWWTGSWSTKDEAGTEYNYIEQFDKYFVRLAFTGPNATYYVDDIALYKSWIGGAESNGYIIRVNFGYQTNLAELAKASEFKAIELPGEYFEVTGYELDEDGEPLSDEPAVIEVESGEYHSDGYLYLWLEDECEYYKDLRVKFINPEDPSLQLKYNGSLYPMGLDSAWVNAGKIVPNFENEFVVPNPRVYATSIKMLAPVLKSTTPEDGSFNLPSDTREITMALTKLPYIDTENNTESSQKNVVCVVKAAGVKEYWLADPASWDPEAKTLVFKRQAKYTTPLKGDYTFSLENAKATASSTAAEPQTVNLSFGDLTGGAPVYYYQSQVEWTKEDVANQSIPFGWTASDSSIGETPQAGDGTKQSGRSRMYYFGDGGQFTRGMYYCPRGTSVDARFTYGNVEGYELNLAPGDYWLSFSAFGWDNNAKNTVYVYPLGAEEKGDMKLEFTPDQYEANSKASTGSYVVNIATSYRLSFTIETAGNYVIEFYTPKSANWTGTVLGNIEISNQYSAAYKYLQNLINAQTTAAAKVKVAEETAAKYSGAVLNSLKDLIAKYESFKSTSPSEYNAVTKELNDASVAMQDHINTVDKYYTEYAAAEAMRDQYAGDSAAEKGLAAYAALLAKIKEYADMDPTTKTDAEIKDITEEVTASYNAVTTRVNNNAAFVTALENLKAVLDNEDNLAYAEFDEFVNAQKVYNAEKDDDLIAISDDDLAAATKALNSARNAFNGKVEGVNAMTVQIKALAELAEAIGVDFEALKAGSTADVKAAVAAAIDDDQELAEVMKSAIKYTIYKMIAEGSLDLSSDSLDVTPFIRNYNLYTTAANGVDMEKFYYSYSAPNDRWRVKTGTFETVFPGWKVQGKGGNVHIGSETLNWVSEEKAPIFDAYLGLDWSSSVVVSGTVEGLPAGKYSLGIGSNAQKDGSMLIATVNEVSDTALVVAGTSDLPSEANVFAYGVEVPEGVVSLTYSASSGAGWSRVDNFAAILTGVADVDYAKLVEEAEAAAKEGLNSVEAIEDAASVKYYNINGVQTAQPKGVTIKVTTGKNGKVNAQKVLVK